MKTKTKIFRLLAVSLFTALCSPLTSSAAVAIYKTTAGTGGTLVETFKADATHTVDFANTGLKIRDTDATHQLTIAAGSNLTAAHTFTLTTGDADRTLTLTGNATLNQDVSTTGSPSFAGLSVGTGNTGFPAYINPGASAVLIKGSSDTGSLVFGNGTQSPTNRWLRLGWDATNHKFVFNDYESGLNLATLDSSAGLFITGKLSTTGGVIIGSPTGGTIANSLNVAGDIYKNNTAYTNPDYVLEHAFTGRIVRFADKPGAADYAGLKPLAEVEDFARTNLHLPRFGQNAGHGLFSGSDALLASTEEAYLYLFAHEKRLAALEREVAALRSAQSDRFAVHLTWFALAVGTNLLVVLLLHVAARRSRNLTARFMRMP